MSFHIFMILLEGVLYHNYINNLFIYSVIIFNDNNSSFILEIHILLILIITCYSIINSKNIYL